MTAVGGLVAQAMRERPAEEASLLPLGGVATPSAAARPGIPRIIHQTYPTRQLPEVFARASEATRAMNPGWEYRFYDDDDIERFIATEYPRPVLDCYRRINTVYGAARVDLFRYLLIFRYGGVYLDIKTRMERPLDEVLRDDDTFVSSHWKYDPDGPRASFGRHPELAWHPPGELQQWHVIARAGHPFLEAVIRRVLRNLEQYTPFRFGVGKMGVIRLTGPIPYTQAIVPLLPHHAHRIVESEQDLGLGYTVFDDGGQHKAHFARHYSQLQTPIVPIRPVIERPFNVIYQCKRLSLLGREQLYRVWRVVKRLRRR